MLKAIVLPGAVASAVAQRPPVLPVLSHWYVLVFLNMLQKLWQNQGLITTPNNFIITRIKTKINQYLLKPGSHHRFAATIRQKWPWILVFLPCMKKKIWPDILLLSTYSTPKIILQTKSSWQWWRPKRPCLSSWFCTAVQWSLDFWPRFLWWCMYIHNQNACYSPTHFRVTNCPMAAMQVSYDITSDLPFFFYI